VTITGTLGRIEIEIPFNAPPDRPSRIVVEGRRDGRSAIERDVIEIEICDQYTIQGDLFSEAVRRGEPAPYPLEDSVSNLRVIDALFRSAQTNGWHAVT
jgi:predicted dehydrogenase